MVFEGRSLSTQKFWPETHPPKGLIVQKFGGTSVAGTVLIKKAALITAEALRGGNRVAVVVSAMSGATNGLVSLCAELSSLDTDEKKSEYDSALCSGEIVTSALLSLALMEQGLKAKSFLAFQLPLVCSGYYGKAFSESLDSSGIEDCLEKGIVPVIAGFQGVTSGNRFVTLGRGGSDVTAALVAAKLKADYCDIYTDVEGVFESDPRVIWNARKLRNLSFDEALELSSSGAKVLHPRCVEIAMRYGVPLRVFSSFAPEEGTLISKGIGKMENRTVRAIASNKNLLKITLKNSDRDFYSVCGLLGEGGISVEWALNGFSDEGKIFVINLTDKRKAEKILRDEGIDFSSSDDIALVSLIGYGLKNDPSFLGKILSSLKTESIEIESASVCEIKISLSLKDSDAEKAIRILHRNFLSNQ